MTIAAMTQQLGDLARQQQRQSELIELLIANQQQQALQQQQAGVAPVEQEPHVDERDDLYDDLLDEDHHGASAGSSSLSPSPHHPAEAARGACSGFVFKHKLRLEGADEREGEHVLQNHTARMKADVENINIIIKKLSLLDHELFPPTRCAVAEVAEVEDIRNADPGAKNKDKYLVAQSAKDEVQNLANLSSLLGPSLTLVDVLFSQATGTSNETYFAGPDVVLVLSAVRRALIRAVIAMDHRFAELKDEHSSSALAPAVRTALAQQRAARVNAPVNEALYKRRERERTEAMSEALLASVLQGGAAAGTSPAVTMQAAAGVRSAQATHQVNQGTVSDNQEDQPTRRQRRNQQRAVRRAQQAQAAGQQQAGQQQQAQQQQSRQPAQQQRVQFNQQQQQRGQDQQQQQQQQRGGSGQPANQATVPMREGTTMIPAEAGSMQPPTYAAAAASPKQPAAPAQAKSASAPKQAPPASSVKGARST
jgi:hypothetical protein